MENLGASGQSEQRVRRTKDARTHDHRALSRQRLIEFLEHRPPT
jgi:hypothetical protein